MASVMGAAGKQQVLLPLRRFEMTGSFGWQTPETKPASAPSKYLAERDIERTGIYPNRREPTFMLKFVGLGWR